MAIDPNFPNPYLPTTDAEAEALAQFKAQNADRFSVGLRKAFGAGILANPTSGGSVEEERFEILWDRFIEADMEIPRTYPTTADVFVAGYRASASELTAA